MRETARKQKLFSIFFVAGSLATFIILGMIYFFLKYNFIQFFSPERNETYDFKDFKQNDPLMTRLPGDKDILAAPIISSSDPQIGKATAPVTIVEFSDFECQFCREQEKIINSLFNFYDGKIRLIWKNFPENDHSSLSFRAAIAGRCAQEQGQFWNYHDLLYQTANLNEENFIKTAASLKLDLNQFGQCLNDKTISKKIDDNIAEANALNISGIPFIYINRQELMGQMTLDDLKILVEQELKNTKN